MNKNKLLEFIEQNNNNNINVFEYLQFDLNNKIYSFGKHFINPNEKYFIVLFKFKQFVFSALTLVLLFVEFFIKTKKNINNKNIISSAYFNLGNTISNKKYNIHNVPWKLVLNQTSFDLKLFIKSQCIKNKLEFGSFNDLLNKEFDKEAREYYNLLKVYIVKNRIRALFLPMDIGFFEKMTIDIFKELNLPTFNIIHGLPGMYNEIDYNRTDYLVVWGEAIKNNFINKGYNPNKIIVSGHPKYKIKNNANLKFSLDDILVITKSLNGSQYSDRVVIGDRSNLIYYLYTIQKVLTDLGVNKVRLRPHPSENIEWYRQYINNTFFEIDIDSIDISLKKSTLVIGGTSTMFLESLIYGVNYVVYEPIIDGCLTLNSFEQVPPFDGNNAFVPVANSEAKLIDILVNEIKVDIRILDEYIEPNFNSELIISKIT